MSLAFRVLVGVAVVAFGGGCGQSVPRVRPVGPEGSPRARGLPARPPVAPVRPVALALTLAWEAPRPGSLPSVSIGWTPAHVVRCERLAPTEAFPTGRLRVAVARPANGRRQEATLELSADETGTGAALPASFEATIPQGIAVRVANGDTLRSVADGALENGFTAAGQVVDGRLRGTFRGHVRGDRTGDAFRASGHFDCLLTAVR